MKTSNTEKCCLNDSPNFDIPQELLEVLPSDPFEQLDVARKITSIALSRRVGALESETTFLREQLADRDHVISSLDSQLEWLDDSLNEANDKLAAAQQEKESLSREKAQLSNTVKKLNRDVVKLEAFRKTLMRSLQDEEENTANAPNAVPSSVLNNTEDDIPSPTSTTALRSQFPDSGNSFTEDTETEAVRPRVSHGMLLASQTTTPRLTPRGSPPTISASESPSRTPKPLPPCRRHSISFSTARGLFDDKTSVFSSMPSSQFSSMSSLDSG